MSQRLDSIFRRNNDPDIESANTLQVPKIQIRGSPFLEVAWKEYLELYVCIVVPDTVYVTAQLQLSSVQNFMVS